jgi:hypothetical protein
VFHPKIWALRFVSPDGEFRHRFVCLSRNLTGDRSWDTVLVLDEEPEAALYVDPVPLAAFLTELIPLSIKPMNPERQRQVEDLANTIAGAQFAVPPPFTEASLLPLGNPSGGTWPLPDKADALVVISPFLDAGALARLPVAKGATVVSRDQTFDRLGSKAFSRVRDTMVLQPAADGADADVEQVQDSSTEIRTGLHAKVLAWDVGSRGHLLTGSANCTGAAFGGNVEFNVHLSGPVATCGATAVLGDSKERSGLVRLLQPYSIASAEGVEDVRYALEKTIEEFHIAIAGITPELHVSDVDHGYDVALKLSLPDDPVGHSLVRPVSLNHKVHAHPLTEPLPIWRGLSLAALTPYLVVETTLAQDGVTVTRACVVTANLIGAPADRTTRILRELLANEEQILRYLALLLGDPSLDDMLSRFAETSEDEDDEKPAGSRGGPSFSDLILLEPLVRAASRGDASLRRAHELLTELRDDEGNLPHVSAEFQQLWQVVWDSRETA